MDKIDGAIQWLFQRLNSLKVYILPIYINCQQYINWKGVRKKANEIVTYPYKESFWNLRRLFNFALKF